MKADDNGSQSHNEQMESLYVHIHVDGEVYLLPSDVEVGIRSDLRRLKTELRRIDELDGYVEFSTDHYTGEPPEAIETALSLITSFNLYCIPTNFPHPEVYYYYRSFSIYLAWAVEVAKTDIDGIERYLFEADEILEKQEKGTKEYREIQEVRDDYQAQLEHAQYSLKRIEELELEISIEPEGDMQ